MRPLVRSYGESSSDTRSPFITLIRFRRSLPAMVASTDRPASSSTANMPALNFSVTLPITSIASSFGKLFLCSSFMLVRATADAAPVPLTSLPASATAAAVSTAAAAIATTESTLRLGARFVDVESPAIEFPAVQTIDRGVRFRIDAHLDEGEAPGLPGIAIGDDVDAIDGAV